LLNGFELNIVLLSYTSNHIFSTSFGDAMFLAEHTFIHGTHSITAHGQLCYLFFVRYIILCNLGDFLIMS